MRMSLKWRKSWRAVAAKLPKKGLKALVKELEGDGGGLVHGQTTKPWATARPNAEPDAACVVGFCLWKAGRKTTDAVTDAVGKIEDRLPDDLAVVSSTWDAPETEADVKKVRRYFLEETKAILAGAA